ncbi:hypothetical protein [Microcystis aeruginosa]|uniref:hypothetical protein n=1 Tax=Microcystis aeruginosa TaxID=1126 RepID=UPI00287F755E|nr:hypothetical protein [Microcystis aeruginosa]WNF15330.1 hypothetical protein RKE53_02520 [Microcystis aeruginosa NRERC-214]
MGIIDFKSLSNKDSWANPDPAIRKKVQDKLVRLSFDEKAEKLEQELKDLIPSLSGVLNQSVLRDARHGEKFDPEQHFSPILVIQNWLFWFSCVNFCYELKQANSLSRRC